MSQTLSKATEVSQFNLLVAAGGSLNPAAEFFEKHLAAGLECRVVSHGKWNNVYFSWTYSENIPILSEILVLGEWPNRVNLGLSNEWSDNAEFRSRFWDVMELVQEATYGRQGARR